MFLDIQVDSQAKRSQFNCMLKNGKGNVMMNPLEASIIESHDDNRLRPLFKRNGLAGYIKHQNDEPINIKVILRSRPIQNIFQAIIIKDGAITTQEPIKFNTLKIELTPTIDNEDPCTTIYLLQDDHELFSYDIDPL
ncbi:MAG TPA: hypothetical protein VHA74_01650 [Candidatus Dojkabacteria bacterium]|nr:hypothetical protein [Candidatus Dojkabacteria bacterium]